MGDIVAAHGEAEEWRRKMKTARPESNAWTEFVGVYRLPSGAYGAAIWDPSSRTQVWLGTFGTAEDAARAYGAAAVKLPGASKKTARSESDARTEFRGVYRLPSGAYGASIWDPSSQTQVWLGTFDTVEHAAGAYGIARAYGAAAAAAAKLPGAREKRIRSKFRGVRRSSSGRYAASIRESKGKALTWLGTFGTAEEAARAHDAAAVRLHGARAITNFGVDGIVGGARHLGVSTAELQHVDELLKDMECTNEKEALIDAAAILHQIARGGGHGDDEHS